MATELATAYISLVPSARGMKSNITKELGGAGTAAAANTESAFKSSANRSGAFFKSALGAAAVGVGAAVVGAIKLGTDSIKAASDLGEAQSKVNAIFGPAGQAQVDAWAGKAAQAFGQSKQQATDAIGTYGNLLTSFGVGNTDALTMSTTLTGLASDLASFNNTSVDEAITALRSGLSGEMEPLKRYGVALDDASLKAKALAMGISDGKSTLTPAQKAQAAYALILERTSNAQGDFARTSGGLANQQRVFTARWENLKVTIGQGLLPILNRALPVIGRLFDSFEPFVKRVAPQVQAAFQAVFGWFSSGDGQSVVADAEKHFGTYKMIFNDVVEFVRKNWPQIRETVTSVMTSVRDVISSVVDVIRTIWNRWGDDIMRLAQWALPKFLEQVQKIGKIIADVFGFVAAALRGDWSEAWVRFRDAAVGVFDAVRAQMSNMDEVIRAVWSALLDWLVERVKDLPALMAAASEGMWDGFKWAFKAALNWIIDKWNGLEFTLPEMEAFGVTIGGSTIGTPNIPKFHDGGIYRAPTAGGEGLALLRDGERVLTPEQSGAGIVFNGPVTLGSQTALRDLEMFSRRRGRAVRSYAVPTGGVA